MIKFRFFDVIGAEPPRRPVTAATMTAATLLIKQNQKTVTGNYKDRNEFEF